VDSLSVRLSVLSSLACLAGILLGVRAIVLTSLFGVKYGWLWVVVFGVVWFLGGACVVDACVVAVMLFRRDVMIKIGVILGLESSA